MWRRFPADWFVRRLPTKREGKRGAVWTWYWTRSTLIRRILVGWLMLYSCLRGIWRRMIHLKSMNRRWKKFYVKLNRCIVYNRTKWTSQQIQKLKRPRKECFCGKRKSYQPSTCSSYMIRPNSLFGCGRSCFRVLIRRKNDSPFV